MTNKHIALLAGGMSSEREVSFMSAKGVEESLNQLGYKVTVIDVDQSTAQKLADSGADIAFIALHGTYGEDGCIQGLLEIMGIPYTHCGVEASAIAMNKQRTKDICAKLDIRCPNGQVVSPEQIADGDIKIDRPFVIKAVDEGSSVGVYIIKEDDELPTQKELEKYRQFIVEEFIDGRELSVATIDNGSLGVIELRAKEGFYDYKNKYSDGATDYIMPADIDAAIYQQAMDWSYQLHRAIGCRGLTRSDLILSNDNQLYMLEINTHPGLTPYSLAPKIAKHANMSYNDLVEYLIENAQCEK